MALCEYIPYIFLYDFMVITINICYNYITAAFLFNKLVKWKCNKQPLYPWHTHHSCCFVKHNATSIHMRNNRLCHFAPNLIWYTINMVNQSRNSCFPIIYYDWFVNIEIFPNICGRVHKRQICKKFILIHASTFIGFVYSQATHQFLLNSLKWWLFHKYSAFCSDLTCWCCKEHIFFAIVDKSLMN